MVCIDFHHRWKCGTQNFCPPLKWLNQLHAATPKITLLMMKPPCLSPNSLLHFTDPFPTLQKNEPALGSHQWYHPSPTSSAPRFALQHPPRILLDLQQETQTTNPAENSPDYWLLGCLWMVQQPQLGEFPNSVIQSQWPDTCMDVQH